MNSFSKIELFVKTVEEGSFSAAARHYGLTPSSISRHISYLEEELGTRLFYRTTRKQNLTETGQIYFEYARRITTDMEAAKQAVNQLSKTPSGTLHVTAENDLATSFIAPILPDFMNQYPKIEIRFSMSTNTLDVVDSAVDLAIRFGHLKDTSLMARKIASSHSIICASPYYLAKEGRPNHPRELETHNCLSFRVSTTKNTWQFEKNNETFQIPISGQLKANSLTFLREIALKGQGVVMLPTFMIKHHIQNGALVPILKEYPLIPAQTPINAIYANKQRLAPKVRVFIEFLKKRLKNAVGLE